PAGRAYPCRRVPPGPRTHPAPPSGTGEPAATRRPLAAPGHTYRIDGTIGPAITGTVAPSIRLTPAGAHHLGDREAQLSRLRTAPLRRAWPGPRPRARATRPTSPASRPCGSCR